MHGCSRILRVIFSITAAEAIAVRLCKARATLPKLLLAFLAKVEPETTTIVDADSLGRAISCTGAPPLAGLEECSATVMCLRGTFRRLAHSIEFIPDEHNLLDAISKTKNAPAKVADFCYWQSAGVCTKQAYADKESRRFSLLEEKQSKLEKNTRKGVQLARDEIAVVKNEGIEAIESKKQTSEERSGDPGAEESPTCLVRRLDFRGCSDEYLCGEESPSHLYF